MCQLQAFGDLDTSDIEGSSFANTSCCGGHGFSAVWIISCLLNICLIFELFLREIVALCLLSVFSLGALFFYGGVMEMCVCALHSADMVSCVLPA